MKRFIALVLSILLCLCFVGCSVDTTTVESETEQTGMFIVIQDTYDDIHAYYDIVYHKDTKVMYAVSDGSSNKGNFTLLVNPDGSPMLYKGD